MYSWLKILLLIVDLGRHPTNNFHGYNNNNYKQQKQQKTLIPLYTLLCTETKRPFGYYYLIQAVIIFSRRVVPISDQAQPRHSLFAAPATLKGGKPLAHRAPERSLRSRPTLGRHPPLAPQSNRCAAGVVGNPTTFGGVIFANVGVVHERPGNSLVEWQAQ